MKLSKNQFDALRVGSLVKDYRSGKFEAIEKIQGNLLILKSGYVVGKDEMVTADVQALKDPKKQTAPKKNPTPSVEANAGAELMSRYPKRSNEILRLVSKGFTVSQIEASFVMEDAGKKVRR